MIFLSIKLKDQTNESQGIERVLGYIKIIIKPPD